ncbi:MAG: hypothetical protein JW834_04000 [Candidatus Diapherotrites archaeon]|nr:hypothetical protein [Candidatus Diapherotrites archaeon]
MVSVASAAMFSVQHSDALLGNASQAYSFVVTDRDTGHTVEGVSILLGYNGNVVAESVTNNRGYAVFSIHPQNAGTVMFRVQKEGYNDFVVVQDIQVESVEPAPEEEDAGLIVPEDEVAPLTTEPLAAMEEPSELTGLITAKESNGDYMWLVVGSVVVIAVLSTVIVLYTEGDNGGLVSVEEEDEGLPLAGGPALDGVEAVEVDERSKRLRELVLGDEELRGE